MDFDYYETQLGAVLNAYSSTHDFVLEYDPDTFDIEDFFGSLQEMGGKRFAEKALGPLSGLPIKRANDIISGAEDLFTDEEDEWWAGVLKFLGWTPYIIDKKRDLPGVLPALGVIE